MPIRRCYGFAAQDYCRLSRDRGVIGRVPRPYADVMEAWRTSCPRLPVWEEANARGFLEQRHRPGGEAVVVVSEAGIRRLEERATMRGDARAATPTVGGSSSR